MYVTLLIYVYEQGDASVFPLVGWQFVALETRRSGEWCREPLLAFARDKQAWLVRVTPEAGHQLHFQAMQQLQFAYSIISLKVC